MGKRKVSQPHERACVGKQVLKYMAELNGNLSEKEILAAIQRKIEILERDIRGLIHTHQVSFIKYTEEDKTELVFTYQSLPLAALPPSTNTLLPDEVEFLKEKLTAAEMKLMISIPDRSIADYLARLYYHTPTAEKTAPSPGQPSQWTGRELYHAVITAVWKLHKKKQKLSLDNAAEALKEEYPDKAPPTGNALRVLLQRFDIDWKSVKNAQYL
jgi:hypothetical protein